MRPFSILALLLCLPLAAASADKLPAASTLERSDGTGLSLRLHFDDSEFRATDEGRYLQLDACALESAGEGSRASGAPMLPVWRGLVALPPGHVARLSWRLVEAEPVDGRPLPFPTPRAQQLGEETIYDELLIEDPAAYAERLPISAQLGEVRGLRDLRTVEIIVSPVAWDSREGLSLARELVIDLRFTPETGARAAAALMEAPRKAEKHWDRIYAGALLNAAEAGEWKRRTPARFMAERGPRATAALKLLTADDGLYALLGDSLAAHGVALGTSLADIALYRHRFGWDGLEQPLFEQIAEPRYFIDENGDGLLDAGDRMVFLGRRLRHETESVDPIEWFGRASARYVAVAPELALPMADEAGWSEAGSFPVRDSFRRRLWVQGESSFHYSPPNWYYNGLSSETWDDNLYYWPQPLAHLGYKLHLPMSSPAYRAGSEATLRLLFQGASRTGSSRQFGVSIENSGIGCTLPEIMVSAHYTEEYEEAVPADCLVDGENTLVVDRLDDNQWRAYLKWWELEYESDYRALDDSLHFHADGATGPAELRIGGLSSDVADWQLLRDLDGTPRRVTLEAANEAGVPGDRELRLRRDLEGGESWWLADTATLRSPVIEAPADIALLEDGSPADLLVISHELFSDGIQRLIDYREAQGYTVKHLESRQIWDAFHAGARGAWGLRHAARFALQQWGVEALLLVGDANKDARGIHDDVTGWDPMPDFLPLHSIHEFVGVDEVVALDEWIVKREWNDWPGMLMGRLPVGSVDELEIVLDKIECLEDTDPDSPCGEGDGWRKRFFLAADDCWIWNDPGDPCVCGANEWEFEEGQTELIELLDSSWVGDIEGVPFNLSVLTDDWFLENNPVYPSELETLLRPIVSPVFLDSLSQGYLMAVVQSHANRGQVAHELILKTAGGGHDQDYLTNVNRPFFWMLFGCHGNEFAAYNEGKSNVGDCLGEHLLFADDNRGAVASYASDGFEFLFPNLRWERDWWEIMTTKVDPDGELVTHPEWRAGELQLVVELRFGDYDASYRTHLLGDPLLRLDAGPPRLRLFVNEAEVAEGDRIPVQSVGDTLHVSALIWDETYLADIKLRDPVLGEFAHELTPAFSAEAAFPLDSLAPMDTTAFQLDGRSRAWRLTAKVPYDFAMDALILEGRDLAGRTGTFTMEAPKQVDFVTAGGDTLSWGQWVSPSGELDILVTVPSVEILPEAFSLLVDGLPSGVDATATAESNIYRFELPYAWSSGEHRLTVQFEGQDYGGIRLLVDDATRLLAGLIFPNPFRNVTTFHFELTSDVSRGTLSIYTLGGRRIYRRELGALAAGEQPPLVWEGMDQTGDKIANGVYIARLALTDQGGEQVIWEDKVVRMR
jgi:hypothetical protein